MAEALTLGLCTSGSRLVACAYDGKKYHASRRKVFNQERVLFRVAEACLRRGGGSLRDVRAVCAARGPGRFTGTRIALTLAGVLKELAGARVFTATIFEILARQVWEAAHFTKWRAAGGVKLAVLLHAFKDEYFCQFFSAGPGLKRPRPASEPVWLPEAGLRALLAEQAGGFYAIADEEERPGIYGLLPAGTPRAPACFSRVLPEYIVITASELGNGSLKPLYLKPAKYELGDKKP